jgi:hypothetical protein
MNDFLVWLSSNSAASTSIAIAIVALVIVFIFLYVIAFFQGREISFWPPKIGQKKRITHQTIHYLLNLKTVAIFRFLSRKDYLMQKM